MGITRNCVKFLSYAKTKGVSYEKTIMLGRQTLFVADDEMKEVLSKFNISFQSQFFKATTEHFAEPLFRVLGANVIDSLDYSNFENASILADLNEPIPASLQSKYTAVFDGGTLEHVFNFPQAIKNCMDMLHVGGHFVSITPTNNQCGHGFYQFSPELFFSLFTYRHGFKLNLIAIGVELPDIGIAEWYAVQDPHHVKQRVTLTNSSPSYLMIMAEKIADTKDIILRPMQSDYQFVWEVFSSIKNDIPREKENKLIYYYRKYTPEFLKRIVRNIMGRTVKKQINIEGFGKVNSDYFRKIEL